MPVKARCVAAADGGNLSYKWQPTNLTGGFQGSPSAGRVQPLTTNTQSVTAHGAFAGLSTVLNLMCQESKGLRNSAEVHFDVTGPVLKQEGVQPKIGQYPLINVKAKISRVTITRRHVDPTDKTYDPWMGPFDFQRRGVQVTVPLGIFLHADANSLLPGSELAWMQVVRLSAEQKAGKDDTVQTCTQRPGGDTAKPTSPPTYQYPYSTNGDLIDIPGIKLKLCTREKRGTFMLKVISCGELTAKRPMFL
jgi:hypothetical protein